MFVFRIVQAKYAKGLQASGRAARWNPNKVAVIYTSSSQSLACLENVVHRTYLGLNHDFKALTIHIPDTIEQEEIKLADLPSDWKDFEQMPYTQILGNKWITEERTAVMKIPSSIIAQEHNYLLNPAHPEFKKIKITAVEPFVFDERIKR